MYFNEQSKSDYTIKVGETFELKLTDNPSTGYYWTWINEDTTRIVQLANKRYVSSTKEPIPGAGGTLYLTFKGIKAGTDTIKLIHSRSSTSSNLPIKSIIVTILE